jgi:hypothetical protein
MGEKYWSSITHSRLEFNQVHIYKSSANYNWTDEYLLKLSEIAYAVYFLD